MPDAPSAAAEDWLLLPAPRELRRRPGRAAAARDAPLRVTCADDALAERIERRLRAAWPRERPACALRVAPGPDLRAEGFALSIGEGGVEVSAADARGLLWATGALEQLALQCGATLPCLELRDAPDLAERGYMLDVSRDRVPTRETLAHLVEVLAACRLNQLQLYTEHTFAYEGHETVWRNASPLTAEDVRWLDGLCAERGIELVPNQNGFGHMERWLRHPEYRHLAELPEGGGCLAPGPESLAFVEDLYAQLMPCFRSRKINIGCDETFDLGRGRSREACEARGHGRVYLDFVLALMRALQAKDRHVQFWGDIIARHPDLVGELPDRDVTALAWGYEAPMDPAALPAAVRDVVARFSDVEALRGFDARAAPFARSGVPFQVCPGTSAWNSLIGRWPNARDNALDAARVGAAVGARGMLLTDWGDNGHLQPPAISLLPLVHGAAVAWCATSAAALDVGRALDRLILRDATGTCAAALAGLGEVHAATGLSALNASPLFTALLRPLGDSLLAWGESSPQRLAEVVERIEHWRARLADARPRGFGGEIVAREIRQAAALARHGAWRIARARFAAGPDVDALRDDLETLRAEQIATWRARSREGGLVDSLGRLDVARNEYGGPD